MDVESKSILRKVVIDVLCLACVGFSVLYFYLFGKPYKRGFFCDDESIRLPYKDSTVTSGMLYFVGLVMPICVFLVAEWVHYRSNELQVSRSFMGRSIHPWVWRCYCVIGVFGFGAACSQLLTDIAKYSIGRLRPHFWDVCKPNVNCSLPLQPDYIANFECQNPNPRLNKECRVQWRGSHLLRHFAQFVCLSLAWGTALSRVSDYKHHWSDVLAGSLLGTAVAVLVVKYVSDLRLGDTQAYKPAATTDPAQNNGINLTVTTDT